MLLSYVINQSKEPKIQLKFKVGTLLHLCCLLVPTGKGGNGLRFKSKNKTSSGERGLCWETRAPYYYHWGLGIRMSTTGEFSNLYDQNPPVRFRTCESRSRKGTWIRPWDYVCNPKYIFMGVRPINTMRLTFE